MNDQLEHTFTDTPTDIGNLKLRPFSLGSLSLCRRLKLTMLTGDAAPDTLSEDEKQQQIVAFIYIQSQPLDAVLASVKSANFFEDVIMPFSMTLPVSAIPPAVQEIKRVLDAASAAYVETMPKPGDKPEDAPPNS